VLKLTDEGRLLLASAEPVARNLDAALLQILPPAQREPFLKALRTVVRVLEEETTPLSGYENFLDYGGPEPWWREACGSAPRIDPYRHPSATRCSSPPLLRYAPQLRP
jgi:hypothetical protein